MYLFCPYCGLDLRFIIKEKLIARLTLRDRLVRIYMLFRDPFRTMEHIASAPDLMGGFILMLLCGFILTLKFILIFSWYGVGISSISFIYLLISAFTLEMMLWLSLSMIIGFAIKIVGGTGSFREILSLVGYNQVYLLIAHIISLLSLAGSGPVGSESPGILTPAASIYIPFIFVIAWFVGYGVSYTHMLKRVTAISASISASLILIIFFYMI